MTSNPYPHFRNRIFAFLLVSFTAFSCQETHKEPVVSIAPPLQGVAVTPEAITIDPGKAQVVHFGSGSSIEVPENAFVDAKGKVITDPVELKLQTFDSPAEIIASGIPMEYSDGETAGTFESAGMFDLSGSAGGEEVFIQKGKDLAVNMASPVFGEYDFFHFEETEDPVTLQAGIGGIDQATVPKERRGRWKKLAEAPKATFDSSKVLKNFNLKFNTTDYPPLAELASLDWKLGSNEFDPTQEKYQWVLEEGWAGVEVSQPEFIQQEPIASTKLDHGSGFIGYDSYILSPDSEFIVTKFEREVQFWDKKGKNLAKIKNASPANSYGSPKSNNYILIQIGEGFGIFRWNGERIGTIKNAAFPRISKDETRILYRKRKDIGALFYFETLSFDFVLANIDGTTIKEIELDGELSSGSDWFYNTDAKLVFENKYLTLDVEGVNLWDLNGKKIAHLPGVYRSATEGGKGQIAIMTKEYELILWDYQKQKTLSPPTGSFNLEPEVIDNTIYSGSFSFIPHTQYIIIEEGNHKTDKLWDYKTDQVTDLPFNLYSYKLSPDYPHLVPGMLFGETNHTFYFWDLNSQKALAKLDNYSDWSELGFEYPAISEDGRHIMISSLSHNQLRKIDGTLVKDFTAMDSTIIESGFISNDTLFTCSKMGVFKTWDLSGKELSSKILPGSGFAFPYVEGKKMFYYSRDFWVIREFDLRGNHELTYVERALSLNKDYDLQILTDSEFNLNWNPLIKRPDDLYVLNLFNGKRKFQCYVYLNQADLDAIARYNRFRSDQYAKENERQKEELKVIRTFKLANFGVYNWDRIYRADNTIEIAADFDFGVPVDYANITVFLISEINGPAVFKFYEGTYNAFTIFPDRPNRLLAVLPDNKVATFSREEFASLDLAAIEAAGKYTFKMKPEDAKVSSVDQLETLLQ